MSRTSSVAFSHSPRVKAEAHKRWQCGKCRRVYDSPIPVSYVECKGQPAAGTTHAGVVMKPVQEQ